MWSGDVARTIIYGLIVLVMFENFSKLVKFSNITNTIVQCMIAYTSNNMLILFDMTYHLQSVLRLIKWQISLVLGEELCKEVCNCSGRIDITADCSDKNIVDLPWVQDTFDKASLKVYVIYCMLLRNTFDMKKSSKQS